MLVPRSWSTGLRLGRPWSTPLTGWLWVRYSALMMADFDRAVTQIKAQ